MVVILCTVVLTPIFAAEGPLPIVLTSSGDFSLKGHFELLEDRNGGLTIEQVVSPTWAGKFVTVPDEVPNLGLTKSVFWVRFQVRNPDHQAKTLHLSFHYPVTDHVSLFVPKENSGFIRLDAGDSVPNSPQNIPNHNFVFPIQVPAGRTTTYHLRVQTTAAMTLSLTLRSPDIFYLLDRRNQIVSGLLYGATAGFMFFFLGMSLKLRNPSCWWFAWYVLFFGTMVAIRVGHFQELLGAGFLPWNNLMLIVAQGSLYFMGAKLLRTFLNVQKYSHRIDRILQTLQWMSMVYIPVVHLDNPVRILFGLVLFFLGPMFSSVVSIVYWLKGVPNAKYFAIGWLIGHLTSTLDFLRITGCIPYLPVFEYTLPISLISTIVFFSLALVEQTYTFQFWAKQDGLTGLANRRQFDQHLEAEWNRQQRSRRPLTLIMADVDYFKQYNDTYGHSPGDDCLMAIAEVLRRFTRRSGELAARWGGEEFVVLLPEIDQPAGTAVAEQIRAAVENLGLPHTTSKVKPVVTISLGVATTIPDSSGNPNDLLRFADEALYVAKNNGRNQVSPAAVR